MTERDQAAVDQIVHLCAKSPISTAQLLRDDPKMMAVAVAERDRIAAELNADRNLTDRCYLTKEAKRVLDQVLGMVEGTT